MSGRPESLGPPFIGAKGRNRTVDTALFRRVLYRLSYLGAPISEGAPICERTACSSISFVNRDALVTLATLMGLEPTTFAVTGRRSNQLSYTPAKKCICFVTAILPPVRLRS